MALHGYVESGYNMTADFDGVKFECEFADKPLCFNLYWMYTEAYGKIWIMN